MYEIALFLHLVGVVLLFAALGVEVFAGARLRRAGDVAELRAAARLAHGTGPVHGVASLLILANGIFLAMERFSLTDGWILSSLIVTLAFSVIGPAVNAKRIKALLDRVEAAPVGEADTELGAALRDPVLWTLFHGMAASAVGILFLMTNKPTDAVSYLVLVATFAAGAVAGRMTSQRGVAVEVAPA